MSVRRDRLKIWRKRGMRVCLDIDSDGVWHVVREEKLGKRWRIIDFTLADREDADKQFAAWTQETVES